MKSKRSVFTSRWAIASVALWALAGSLLAQIPAPGPLGAGLVDDEAIIAHVESAGAALIKEGKVAKTKAIRTALTKVKTCALELPAPDATPLAPEEIAARRTGSVVVVGILAHTKKKGKFELAGCTGFALAAGGVIVTNYHVIDSPEADALVVMTRDGTVVPITEVLAADKLADIAIVLAPGINPAPIPLASARPSVGAPIWALSHPDHNFFSLTDGMVSRHFIAVTDNGKTPQMAVTADFGSGSSGGPILDRQGCVTGMVCSTTSVYWEDTKGKVKDLQMVFKHCVPVESIRKLVTPPAP